MIQLYHIEETVQFRAHIPLAQCQKQSNFIIKYFFIKCGPDQTPEKLRCSK